MKRKNNTRKNLDGLSRNVVIQSKQQEKVEATCKAEKKGKQQLVQEQNPALNIEESRNEKMANSGHCSDGYPVIGDGCETSNVVINSAGIEGRQVCIDTDFQMSSINHTPASTTYSPDGQDGESGVLLSSSDEEFHPQNSVESGELLVCIPNTSTGDKDASFVSSAAFDQSNSLSDQNTTAIVSNPNDIWCSPDVHNGKETFSDNLFTAVRNEQFLESRIPDINTESDTSQFQNDIRPQLMDELRLSTLDDASRQNQFVYQNSENQNVESSANQNGDSSTTTNAQMAKCILQNVKMPVSYLDPAGIDDISPACSVDYTNSYQYQSETTAEMSYSGSMPSSLMVNTLTQAISGVGFNSNTNNMTIAQSIGGVGLIPNTNNVPFLQSFSNLVSNSNAGSMFNGHMSAGSNTSNTFFLDQKTLASLFSQQNNIMHMTQNGSNLPQQGTVLNNHSNILSLQNSLFPHQGASLPQQGGNLLPQNAMLPQPVILQQATLVPQQAGIQPQTKYYIPPATPLYNGSNAAVLPQLRSNGLIAPVKVFNIAPQMIQPLYRAPTPPSFGTLQNGIQVLGQAPTLPNFTGQLSLPIQLSGLPAQGHIPQIQLGNQYVQTPSSLATSILNNSANSSINTGNVPIATTFFISTMPAKKEKEINTTNKKKPAERPIRPKPVASDMAPAASHSSKVGARSSTIYIPAMPVNQIKPMTMNQIQPMTMNQIKPMPMNQIKPMSVNQIKPACTQYQTSGILSSNSFLVDSNKLTSTVNKIKPQQSSSAKRKRSNHPSNPKKKCQKSKMESNGYEIPTAFIDQSIAIQQLMVDTGDEIEDDPFDEKSGMEQFSDLLVIHPDEPTPDLNEPTPIPNEPAPIPNEPAIITNEPALGVNEPAVVMNEQTPVLNEQTPVLNEPTFVNNEEQTDSIQQPVTSESVDSNQHATANNLDAEKEVIPSNLVPADSLENVTESNAQEENSTTDSFPSGSDETTYLTLLGNCILQANDKKSETMESTKISEETQTIRAEMRQLAREERKVKSRGIVVHEPKPKSFLMEMSGVPKVTNRNQAKPRIPDRTFLKEENLGDLLDLLEHGGYIPQSFESSDKTEIEESSAPEIQTVSSVAEIQTVAEIQIVASVAEIEKVAPVAENEIDAGSAAGDSSERRSEETKVLAGDVDSENNITVATDGAELQTEELEESAGVMYFPDDPQMDFEFFCNNQPNGELLSTPSWKFLQRVPKEGAAKELKEVTNEARHKSIAMLSMTSTPPKSNTRNHPSKNLAKSPLETKSFNNGVDISADLEECVRPIDTSFDVVGFLEIETKDDKSEITTADRTLEDPKEDNDSSKADLFSKNGEIQNEIPDQTVHTAATEAVPSDEQMEPTLSNVSSPTEQQMPHQDPIEWVGTPQQSTSSDAFNPQTLPQVDQTSSPRSNQSATQASDQQRTDPAETTDSDPTALSIPEKKITEQFVGSPESNKISANKKPKSKNKRRSCHQSEVVISEESNTNISSASSSAHSGTGSPLFISGDGSGNYSSGFSCNNVSQGYHKSNATRSVTPQTIAPSTFNTACSDNLDNTQNNDDSLSRRHQPFSYDASKPFISDVSSYGMVGIYQKWKEGFSGVNESITRSSSRISCSASSCSREGSSCSKSPMLPVQICNKSSIPPDVLSRPSCKNTTSLESQMLYSDKLSQSHARQACSKSSLPIVQGRWDESSNPDCLTSTKSCVGLQSFGKSCDYEDTRRRSDCTNQLGFSKGFDSSYSMATPQFPSSMDMLHHSLPMPKEFRDYYKSSIQSRPLANSASFPSCSLQKHDSATVDINNKGSGDARKKLLPPSEQFQTIPAGHSSQRLSHKSPLNTFDSSFVNSQDSIEHKRDSSRPSTSRTNQRQLRETMLDCSRNVSRSSAITNEAVGPYARNSSTLLTSPPLHHHPVMPEIHHSSGADRFNLQSSNQCSSPPLKRSRYDFQISSANKDYAVNCMSRASDYGFNKPVSTAPVAAPLSSTSQSKSCTFSASITDTLKPTSSRSSRPSKKTSSRMAPASQDINPCNLFLGHPSQSNPADGFQYPFLSPDLARTLQHRDSFVAPQRSSSSQIRNGMNFSGFGEHFGSMQTPFFLSQGFAEIEMQPNNIPSSWMGPHGHAEVESMPLHHRGNQSQRTSAYNGRSHILSESFSPLLNQSPYSTLDGAIPFSSHGAQFGFNPFGYFGMPRR